MELLDSEIIMPISINMLVEYITLTQTLTYRIDREGRIFRGGTNKYQQSFLHEWEENILLDLVKLMNFVHK